MIVVVDVARTTMSRIMGATSSTTGEGKFLRPLGQPRDRIEKAKVGRVVLGILFFFQNKAAAPPVAVLQNERVGRGLAEQYHRSSVVVVVASTTASK